MYHTNMYKLILINWGLVFPLKYKLLAGKPNINLKIKLLNKYCMFSYQKGNKPIFILN